jgi:hypothetical protein
MTFLHSYVRNGFTLHWLLSFTELFVLLSVIYAVVRHWQRSGKETLIVQWQNTLRSWIAIVARSGIPVLRWGAAKLLLRLSITHIPTEQELSRNIVAEKMRHIPRWKGWARYMPVMLAAIVGGAIVFILSRPSNIVTFDASQKPDDIIQIVKEYTPYHWEFHRLGDPLKTTFVGHFCESYRPLFSAGMSLKWFRYRDKGPCWDIQPRGFGYHIIRENDIPVLAPNCKALPDRIECTGNQANFEGVTYDAQLW